MGEIVINPSLKIKLNDLVDTLYFKNYFGYCDSAQNYVDKIVDFIYSIPTLPVRKCKNPKYGKYFVRYDNKTNKMSYFITYNKIDSNYYIEDIISPKTKEYKEIISLYIYGKTI